MSARKIVVAQASMILEITDPDAVVRAVQERLDADDPAVMRPEPEGPLTDAATALELVTWADDMFANYVQEYIRLRSSSWSVVDLEDRTHPEWMTAQAYSLGISMEIKSKMDE